VTADRETAPVEKVIALHTVARTIYVAPVLIIIFALLGGWRGAWSSAFGILVVVANFVLAGVILSISARISLQAYHAAALFGFLLRLGLFVGAIALIAMTVDVDRPAFGISAVVSYLALLVLEAVAVSRGEERELTWTK
jgi:hypothetical protein